LSTFPGQVYDADGKRLDRRGAVLTSGRMASYEHRAVVNRPRLPVVVGEDLGVEVERVWVLADDAGFDDIPHEIVNRELHHIHGGTPLLLLSHRAEVVRHIRHMMLVSLLIAEDMAAGRLAE
jgi:hypothetical protein